jgi:hypothetical protein
MTILPDARLNDLGKKKKNHHFTIFSNMEFINPVVFKHACNEKGKKKKKSHTRQTRDNYIMLVT